ncbi:hypothetical protein PTE30175_01528 [Pandoraea terrae]|uniref:Uncharacterized protein n=1 Tax=Pandoraea terrae TaxID=1537710 RepID=A0A5E4TX90_9BURK|nr:hypothetical protein [Pandoraea terrae]VVD90529.1 hypothetical protein PTE30175_01528 [Pandoraea terrae]
MTRQTAVSPELPSLGGGAAQPQGSAERTDVVLDPGSDPYARVAVQAYINACSAEQPWLAEALCRRFDIPAGASSTAARLWRLFHAAQLQARAAGEFDEAAWLHVTLCLRATLGAMNQ